MGDVLREAGRLDEATAKYNEAVTAINKAQVPDQVKEATRRNHLFEQARVAVAKKDLATAKAKAAEYTTQVAVKKVPFEVRQQHELAGLIALADKQPAMAAEEFSRANQQDPKILFLTAIAWREAGNAAKATSFADQGGEVQWPRVQLRLRPEEGGEVRRLGDRVIGPQNDGNVIRFDDSLPGPSRTLWIVKHRGYMMPNSVELVLFRGSACRKHVELAIGLGTHQIRCGPAERGFSLSWVMNPRRMYDEDHVDEGLPAGGPGLSPVGGPGAGPSPKATVE